MPKLRVIIKPPPEPQGDAEQQTAALRDYLLQMSEELAYVLTHLEADNINDSTFARIQSMIPRPYTGLPVMDGDANPGQSEQWARGNHRHPPDTSKADVTALETEAAAREAHEADTGNPHEVTKAQVGLGNVADERQYSAQNPPPIPTPGEVGAIPTTEKGSAGGVAELDANGMVPSAQLPSYVDDVLEYASLSDFPVTGESGKIYVALDTNRTYRWSGSAYVEISESLALGETSSTAYRGDRGKTAYDHSQVTSGNPHNVTAAEVGLGNVANERQYSAQNPPPLPTPADIGAAEAQDLSDHVGDTNNPHGVTAAQTGAMPNTATMDDIQNGTTYAKTTAAQVAQIGTNQTNIGTIEGKIPSAASPSNQLADKAFVTDSITQGTAIFRGSFATKAALLAVAWQTSDPDAPYYVSNNDYAVVLDDETQSGECWRYIYVTGTGWTPQYRINETPLTQAQLDALNSGATAAIISSVADKLDKTGDGKDVTATFTAASTRANISTGEKLSVLFGKIAKWFSDLGTAAFRAATGSITSGSTDLVESGAVYTDVRTRVPNYGKGKNLLRNWYFVGGGTGHSVFPVNQRGKSSYGTGFQYSVDGWLATFGSGGVNVTLEQTGLSVGPVNTSNHGLLVQAIDSETFDAAIGKQVTGSLLLSNGDFFYGTTTVSPSMGRMVSVTYNGKSLYLDLNGSTKRFSIDRYGSPIEIAAVKLELGTEQTLCHNEGTDANPVWVLNDVPDYEYELYRCMTSTADSTDTYANKSLATEQQLAYVETGTTASRAYAVGRYFCWNGLLYRVKTAISSGGTLTPGTNCEQVTEGGLNRLNEPIKINRQVLASSISTGLNTLKAAPTAIAGYKAIGVAGVQFSSTDRTKLNLVEFLLDGGQYVTVQFNSTYTSASGCAVAAFVIYAKE